MQPDRTPEAAEDLARLEGGCPHGFSLEEMARFAADYYKSARTGPWPGVAVPHYALAGTFGMFLHTIRTTAGELAKMREGADDWRALHKEVSGILAQSEAHRAALKDCALAAERERDAAVEVLRALEVACDRVAATRSHETYLRMIDIDQAKPALIELDDARRDARAFLATLQRKEPTDAG